MTFDPETTDPFVQHNQQPEISWGWFDIVAVLGLMLIGTVLIATVLGLLVRFTPLEMSDSLLSPVGYLTAVGFMGMMILGVYLFAARRSGWGALGLRPAPLRPLAATPFLVIVGFMAAALANLAIVRITGEQFENPQVEALTDGQVLEPVQLIMVLFLVAVLAPIGEELLFRGMLYPLLRRQWGAVAAITANAVIFAGAHLIWQLFPALLVIGLLLAFLREWSKSVYPCILYHFLQNTLAVIAINAVLSAGG
ncbi:MAG: CPBP family intramembrane glutamic endopeptidase [Chloroflexaceae bacterium]